MPFGCIVCGSARLEEIKEYNALPRVTSDCKPFAAGGRLFACHGCGGIQKLPDGNWLAEIERIYGDYEIYQLSDGAEQLIFTLRHDRGLLTSSVVTILRDGQINCAIWWCSIETRVGCPEFAYELVDNVVN